MNEINKCGVICNPFAMQNLQKKHHWPFFKALNCLFVKTKLENK